MFEQIFLSPELVLDGSYHPRLIVDAGANIGLSSIGLARRYPRATILALEVESSNFELLTRNSAPYPNIRPLRLGLWSHRSHLAIANPEDEKYGFRVVEVPAATPGSIEAVGVAELLRLTSTSRIDLLKIDIEGAEMEVFQTGSERWLGSVDAMVIELHDDLRPGCRAALDSAIKGEGFLESRHGEYIVLTRRPGGGREAAGAGFPA